MKNLSIILFVTFFLAVNAGATSSIDSPYGVVTNYGLKDVV